MFCGIIEQTKKNVDRQCTKSFVQNGRIQGTHSIGKMVFRGSCTVLLNHPGFSRYLQNSLNFHNCLQFEYVIFDVHQFTKSTFINISLFELVRFT